MSYDASLGGGGWTVGDIKPPTQGATGYPTAGTAGYPAGATPVAATASGGNALTTATLPGVAGKTTYLTSLQISGGGATAAALASGSLSGVLGGTQTLIVGVPAGVAVAVQPLVVNFNPPLPASAVNTAIACALSAFGAGNVVEAVSLQGFQL